MEKSQGFLRHLGIIADGNRRWAKERGLPKIEGHRAGIKTVEILVNAAAEFKIPYLTFYVFSHENWSREESEVNYIMQLAKTKIPKFAKKMAENNLKLLVLGQKERLEPKLISILENAEKTTASCTGTTVCLCFNYGGEQEIADAANAVLRENKLITPESIRQHLYHPEVPDIDMIARTSGEERLSGFMLWRAAYAELYFTRKYFPDMTRDDFVAIIEEYKKRHRRFGK